MGPRASLSQCFFLLLLAVLVINAVVGSPLKSSTEEDLDAIQSASNESENGVETKREIKLKSKMSKFDSHSEEDEDEDHESYPPPEKDSDEGQAPQEAIEEANEEENHENHEDSDHDEENGEEVEENDEDHDQGVQDGPDEKNTGSSGIARDMYEKAKEKVTSAMSFFGSGGDGSPPETSAD